ncbi:MAG: DUF5320 domain-containing protein [Candidatus Cloacimonetes bacterium]|nr:DUF5320 domain-containing protein [Candidatus Cloacimonadota bacterium]
MPRGDRTGPNGMGPMTGRAAGFCAGYDRPGYMNPAGGQGYYGRGYGRGMGFGYGRGLGRGRGYGRGFAPAYPVAYAPYPASAQAENEKDYLENELNMLKEDMKHIEARLNEIKAAEK